MSTKPPNAGPSIAADPVLDILEAAPALEVPVSEEEARLIAEAKAEVAAGGALVPHDEVMRRARTHFAVE